MGSPEKWRFDQGRNVAALTTKQVLDLNEPIRYVIHYDDDDSWAFLCGTTNDSEDYRAIHMEHILLLDESIRSIADLPPGWSAWREDRGEGWERFQEDLDIRIKAVSLAS